MSKEGTTITLAQRMVNVMKEVSSVFKGTTIQMAGGRGYSAVSHDDVARLLHKPLADNGIYVKVSVEKVDIFVKDITTKFGDVKPEYRADVSVEVTFINADNPEDREVCRGFAFAFDSGDKAVGKAESMAVKYVLLKNFVLESTDEEESRDNEINKAPPVKNIVKEVEAKAKASGSSNVSVTASTTSVGDTKPATASSDKKTVAFKRNTNPPATPVVEQPKAAASKESEPEIEM